MFVEEYAAIVVEFDALGAQPLLHHVRPFEMSLPGKRAEAVYDSVAWKAERRRAVERPADGPRRAAYSKVLGDVSVRRDLSARDSGYDLVDAGEEIGFGHIVQESDAVIRE